MVNNSYLLLYCSCYAQLQTPLFDDIRDNYNIDLITILVSIRLKHLSRNYTKLDSNFIFTLFSIWSSVVNWYHALLYFRFIELYLFYVSIVIFDKGNIMCIMTVHHIRNWLLKVTCLIEYNCLLLFMLHSKYSSIYSFILHYRLH